MSSKSITIRRTLKPESGKGRGLHPLYACALIDRFGCLVENRRQRNRLERDSRGVRPFDSPPRRLDRLPSMRLMRLGGGRGECIDVRLFPSTGLITTHRGRKGKAPEGPAYTPIGERYSKFGRYVFSLARAPSRRKALSRSVMTVIDWRSCRCCGFVVEEPAIVRGDEGGAGPLGTPGVRGELRDVKTLD